MSKYHISANQLAEFSEGTTSVKKKIIKQQKTPNKLLIPWYQKAKGAIRKFYKNVKDYTPINEAIQDLRIRIPDNNRQKIDFATSIQALELVKKLRVPKLLSTLEYKIITTDKKDFTLNGVDIKVAPEVIIKARYKNKIYIGGIKIHICKGKPFNFNQCTYVASILYHHLLNSVAEKDEIVLPELCFCLDVFSEKLVEAPSNSNLQINFLKKICIEIQSLWN